MIRTQVYLDEAQVRRLQRLASATGKSQSELIRDAVDRLDLPDGQLDLPPERDAVLEEVFGGWSSNTTDFAAIRREADERLDRLFGGSDAS